MGQSIVTPRNHGKPWRQQEVEKLRKYLLSQSGGIDFAYLANVFGRTAFAMKCAVEKFGHYIIALQTQERPNDDLIINGTNYTEKLELVSKLIDVKIKLLS